MLNPPAPSKLVCGLGDFLLWGEDSFSPFGLLLEQNQRNIVIQKFFINSVSKYLLSKPCVPGTVLGCEKTTATKTDKMLSLCGNCVSSEWNKDSKP